MSHTCEENIDVRIRKIGSGTHYVKQCVVCGKQCGGALSKLAALQLLQGKTPVNFDETLATTNKEPQQHTLIGVFGEVDTQVSSFVEEMIRKVGNDVACLSLKKYAQILEKNRIVNAVSKTERFSNEDELKTWFCANLGNDFDIYPEVSGSHRSGKQVRIDFVLFPKEHLIKNGYDPSPFGVEVKYFNPEHGFTTKAGRCFWQILTYTDCCFNLHNHQQALKYALLFSNLSFESERQISLYTGHSEDLLEWRGMIHLVNHANIGTFNMYGEKRHCNGWVLHFAGGIYCQKKAWNGNTQYHISNPNVINKERIGSF